MTRKLLMGFILILLAIIPACTRRQVPAIGIAHNENTAEFDENYIPMINVTRSVGLQQIRVGDEFMGLTLTGFYRRLQAPGGGGRWAREAMQAEFSGRLTVRGILHGSSDENFWFPSWGNIWMYSFDVDEADYEFIPFPDNDFRIPFRGFSFVNDISFTNTSEELLEMLKLSGLDTEIIDEISSGKIRSISIGATVVLEEFEVSTNAVFNAARISEILAVEQVRALRLGGGGTANFLYVTRRNGAEQYLERLSRGDEFAGFTVTYASSQFVTVNHVFESYREAWLSLTGEQTFMADVVFGRYLSIPQGHLHGEYFHLVVHTPYHELFPLFPGGVTLINAEEVFIRVSNTGEFTQLLEAANISGTSNLRVTINSLEMKLHEGYSTTVVAVQND